MTTPVPELLRLICPSCMCAGGECARCNGTGYVFKDPYDPLTSGEQREEPVYYPSRDGELTWLRNRIIKLEAEAAQARACECSCEACAGCTCSKCEAPR